MNWPPFLPNQILTFNPESDTAIVCGWAQRDRFLQKLRNAWADETTPSACQGPVERRIAAIGNLYSPSRGIDILMRNLLANPNIHQLIFAGPDLSGAMDDVMTMFVRPIDMEVEDCYRHPDAPNTRIHSDIPLSVLCTLLKSIKVFHTHNLKEVVEILLNEVCEHKITFGDQHNARMKRMKTGPLFYPPPRINPPTLPAPNNVHPIRTHTVEEAYLELLYQIMTFGKQIDTHYDEPTRELMNLITIVTSQTPDPETIPEFIPFDMNHLEEYIPHLCTNVEDPDVTYTYGNLIRAYFGVDQVKKVSKKLADDESSRSAVISLVDQKWDKKHSPCLNHIWFRLAGGMLHMTAVIRSNDMFFGWPENAYGLRKLQDLVRVLIMNYKGDFQDDKRYGMGDLTIISQSAHIYERDWEPALEIVKKYHRPKEWWDEKGQWMFEFSGDRKKVTAHLMEPDGPIVREFEGTAEEVMQRITDERLVSDVGHALWLGYTLGKGSVDIIGETVDFFRSLDDK